MKVAVKFGLFISLLEITLKLVMIITGKDVIYASEGVYSLLFIFAAGLWLSISSTQNKEYAGGANPIQLLKAGLTTSSIFALLFTLFNIGLKAAQKDFPPGSTPGMMIMGAFFLLFIILMTGGLFSVFISYIISRRKS
ncbi:MAG TPA: hypothetical protein VNZ86_04740 [Bacteroidia bacterium]|jgi:hypothetical protein|nr:hypothetical protein [Bacteroidia bacterium]